MAIYKDSLNIIIKKNAFSCTLNDDPFSIVLTQAGTRFKFWLAEKKNGELNNKHLFKANSIVTDRGFKNGTREDLGEFITCKVAKQVNVKVVDCELAKFYEDEGSIDGVILDNYVKSENVFDLNLEKFIYDAQEKLDYLNIQRYDTSVSLVLELLNTQHYRIKYNLEDKDLEKIREDLIKIVILDYYLGQVDRDFSNMSFLVTTHLDNYKTLEVAPMFDNGLTLMNNFLKDEIDEYFVTDDKAYKNKLEEAIKNRKPYLSISHRNLTEMSKRIINNIDDIFRYLDEDGNIITFEEDLAREIVNNKKLLKFVNDINTKVDFQEILDLTNGVSLNKDLNKTKFAKMCFDMRKEELEKAIDKEFQIKRESEKSVK